jgi:hypothetical protein
MGCSLMLSFTPEELARVRELITAQYLRRISVCAPQHVDEFAALGLDRYHEKAHLLDHVKTWPKVERILPESAKNEIREFSVFKRLTEEFGPFAISDEENVGHEELIWRLVRPHHPEDVGPLHADIWFHRVSNVTWPAGTETVKVWSAIHVETGVSGLKYVPGSHLREWEYRAEHRHGVMKPQILEDESKIDIRIFNSRPGDCLVFHENLLHGGVPHQGQRTRVSMELTLLVKKRG